MTGADVFSFIEARKREGEGTVLATVVRSRGSAPAEPGARMAVSRGATAGTVGGGPLEAKVIEAAREVLASGKPRLLSLRLDGEGEDGLGMICGGEQEVFLDPVSPAPRLVIFGGGHVGRALARLAAAAGFSPAVVDDREEFVDPGRLPPGCRPVRMEFGSDWSGLGITPETALVIVTRGHASDRVCLEKSLSTPAAYIGMIGSRKKVRETLSAAGLGPEGDGRIYAPVGLDLGGSSPEEIAVSVLAEIVAVRRGGSGGHLRDGTRITESG